MALLSLQMSDILSNFNRTAASILLSIHSLSGLEKTKYSVNYHEIDALACPPSEITSHCACLQANTVNMAWLLHVSLVMLMVPTVAMGTELCNFTITDFAMESLFSINEVPIKTAFK